MTKKIIENNYQGLLLAAHPRRNDTSTRRDVVLVVKHSDQYSLGLQINKQIVDGLDIAGVMANSGIDSDLDGPVYWGGPNHNTRITVLHTLDWVGSTTSKITDELGISNDTSVLAALNSSQGPEYYRVILGHIKWPPGELELEILGDPESAADQWNCCEADPRLIFTSSGAAQWRQVLATAALVQINQWFDQI